MWQFIVNIVQGGLGIFLLRELFSGIRSSFRQRSVEVHLSRSLRREIQNNITNIDDFVSRVAGIISTNKAAGNYSYLPNFKPSHDIVFRQSASEILKIFDRFDSAAISELYEFYGLVESHAVLIGYYRDRFLGVTTLNYNQDPHIAIQTQINSIGISNANSSGHKIFQTINLVENGNWFWRQLKKKWVYRCFAIVLGLLIIFLPDRKAL